MTASTRLVEHRAIWSKKASLRAVYQSYFNTILKWKTEGKTLEIGAGPGVTKSLGTDIILTDIVYTPWLDVTCDCLALPFEDESFSNIILIDVLHHISRPILFLREAQRVLKPGGRVITLEPGITPLSYLFYKFLHHEDLNTGVDSFDLSPPLPKSPHEGNQSIPTQLFGRDKKRLATVIPMMQVIEKSWLSLFAYPLSGGFKTWTLLPACAVSPILFLERLLLPILGPLAAFRLFVTLEKSMDE